MAIKYKYDYCPNSGMSMDINEIIFHISDTTDISYECEGTCKIDSNLVNGIAVGYTMTATLKIYCNATTHHFIGPGSSGHYGTLYFDYLMRGTDGIYSNFDLRTIKGDVIQFKNDLYKNTLKSVSYSGNSVDSYIDIVITKQLYSVVNIFQ